MSSNDQGTGESANPQPAAAAPTPPPPLRVLPSPPPAPRSVPLSITDSACADFAPCGAVWLFALPSTLNDDSAPGASTPRSLADALVASLPRALATYPQFAGTLRHTLPSDVGPSHSTRHARVWAEYGCADDPGAEVHLAASTRSLAAFLPTSDVSDPSALGELYAPNALAKLGVSPAGPPLVVRLTALADGLAVGVKMHHSLADAQTLSTFMADWAALHRSPGSAPARALAPSLLDAHCPLPDGERDPALDAAARALPQLGLDFWAPPATPRPAWWSAPDGPDDATAAADAARGHERGVPVPWHEWDWAAPVVDRVLALSPADIARLHAAAARGDHGARASRHDALLGAVWTRVVAARALDGGAASLDFALGLRARVRPPLAPDFLGSALVNASATLDVAALAAPTGQAAAAAAVRAALDAFDLPAVGALLHRMAHALHPAREWNCFLGARHTMATSWLGAGAAAGEVDFGTGSARLVMPDMPPCDGLVVLMDADGASGDGERAARWYEAGARVRVTLKVDVMERFLKLWDLAGEAAGETQV